MGNTIEDMIGSGLIGTVGDPTFFGLLLIGAVAGVLLVTNTRGDVKIMILVPTTILAATFAPILRIPLMLIGAVVIVLAALKFINR
jgi:hypothetical protein